MGGKAQRRREKNFMASHGGDDRLPPPPTLKELEAIPSKLRRLIDLQNHRPLPKNRNNNTDDSSRKGEGSVPERGEHKMKGSAAQEETKRMKKRKNSDDIFRDKRLSVGPDQVRNRKKEYFEARKKRKKAKADDVREFPGHEDIKFGDVVQAPPKLNQKKAFTSHDASHERVRLKAVEAYRNLKRWGSRPGLQL